MKTIEQCIKENEAFLPSLKELVKEAIDCGEDTKQIVMIFIKPCETVVDKIFVGNNIVMFGNHDLLVVSRGYNIGQILEL